MAVTVEADPKFKENIPEKPLASAVPRLQSMVSELQRYSFRVKHKPGRGIPARGFHRKARCKEGELGGTGAGGLAILTRIYKYTGGNSERSREQ